MKVVMIVPTGIGCPLGGHAGDANPAAKLLAAVCDELIVHPNVVNASDINEMPPNSLYVDGHALDLFLEGKIALRRVRRNRLLLVANDPITCDTYNAVGAARATLGLEAQVLALNTPLRMCAYMHPVTGVATGEHQGVDELVEQLRAYKEPFDVLAISSEIDVDLDVAQNYLREGKGVNPWGGIEAKVSRLISEHLGIPVAHAPIDGVIKEWGEIVDDRLAAECVSVVYLHCVLKGLHRAPQLVNIDIARSSDLTVDDIDIMISPANCWGRPHQACASAGIEIVWVDENTPTVVSQLEPKSHTEVANYLEAAGLIAARIAGVSLMSIMRNGAGRWGRSRAIVEQVYETRIDCRTMRLAAA